MTAFKQYMERLYLVRCYRQHKFLFFLSLVFIGAVVYGHKSSCEITPALVMGMYAGAKQTQTDSFFMIVADGQHIDLHHTVDEPRRMMIWSTLAAYYRGDLSGGRDPQGDAIREVIRKHPFMQALAAKAINPPEAYQQYLPWLVKYLKSALNKDIHRLQIAQYIIHYEDNNTPVPDNFSILYDLDCTNLK